MKPPAYQAQRPASLALLPIAPHLLLSNLAAGKNQRNSAGFQLSVPLGGVGLLTRPGASEPFLLLDQQISSRG